MQRWKQVWGEPPCVAEAPVWEADGQSAARGACSVLWARSWETPPTLCGRRHRAAKCFWP